MNEDVTRAREPGDRMKLEAVRFPPTILDGVREEIRLANEAAGWSKVTLSDVVRDLVQEALEARRLTRSGDERGAPAHVPAETDPGVAGRNPPPTEEPPEPTVEYEPGVRPKAQPKRRDR